MANKKVLTFILAGGEGKRLMPLTIERAKPAVMFGGTYRLIDFPLSNLINSGYRQTFVLTQYRSQSLSMHVARTWALNNITGEFTSVVPAQQRRGNQWYLGSADAIYQNLNLVEDIKPDIILVLGADHVYRMDYSQMVKFHIKSGAEFTVSGIRQPIEHANQFGVIQTDKKNPSRIAEFLEKPENPVGLPDNPNEVFASMGNYVASTDAFVEALKKDAMNKESKHDMGGDMVPYFVSRNSAYVYDFNQNVIPGSTSRDANYWRDVGTIDQYFESTKDLISPDPIFNLYNFRWPLITSTTGLPPAKFVHAADEHNKGIAENSIVSPGCVVKNSTVRNSVLGPKVFIDINADVSDSILFENVKIGKNAKIKNAILDKNTVVADGVTIGYDKEADMARGFSISEKGIVAIAKNSVIEK